MKPENILFDENYNIKVCDFGLADHIETTDGSGFEKVRVSGTRNYLSPEMHLRLPYSTQMADLFALGIIIFGMVAGRMPFGEAKHSDRIYRLIQLNDQATFWRAHAKASSSSGQPAYADSFKDLISGMLAYHPHERPSLVDVYVHPWIQSEDVATPEEVHIHMLKKMSQLKLNESH